MKIQQISRFRLGEQGRDAGYQISGASAQVDSVMESEFTGMYTTLEIGSEPGTMLPCILDGGYNMDGSRFYLSQIYAEKDFKGRPTPYVHGLILDSEQMQHCFSNPEEFFLFSSENFRSFCNPQQQGREKLEEIEELKKKDAPLMTVEAVRARYRLSDEVYEDLLRHFYEAMFSEGMITLAFGWNQPLATFEDVIRDMMFLAFSSMPAVLRNKITFSNYQIKGMSARMFTVVPEKYCENHKGAWFNLVTGRSSQLQEDIEGTRFKTQFITYLVASPEEEGKRFLAFADAYMETVYRHPEMKLVTAIANVMVPVFYSYACQCLEKYGNEKILETYFKPVNAGRILNSMTRIKVDEPGYVAELLGALLERAIGMNARINDVQFKNLQKYYLETESERYEKAFISALATRDPETVKKLFAESVKEESSLKTDNFIAGLLERIPDRSEILTEEVIQAIADRYPVTESEDLQDFYLDYVNGLYSESMSEEEASSLMETALDFVRDNQNQPPYERAALYLERQLEQLVRYKLVLKTQVLEQLLQSCVEYGNDYGIGENILNYYMQVYMDGELELAAKYYGYLLKSDERIVQEVKSRLWQRRSLVPDYYYVFCELPEIRKNRKLKTPDDYIRELKTISMFPRIRLSGKVLVEEYWKTQEEYFTGKNKNSEDRGSADDRRNHENSVKEETENSVLFMRYQKIRQDNEQIFGPESPAVRSIQNCVEQNRESEILNPEEVYKELTEKILNLYWEYVDINTISPRFYAENFQEIRCSHIKCRKTEEYFESRREFKRGLSHDPSYHPSVNMLRILTTEACIERMELVEERVRRIIEKLEIPDTELSADVLLMKYYSLADHNFPDTDFLRNLTQDQKNELLEGDYNLMAVHPEIYEKLHKYLRTKKKKTAGRSSGKKGIREILLEKKFFLLAGAGALIVLAAVAAGIILMMHKSGQNEDPASESVIERSNVPESQEKENETERKGETEKKSSFSGRILKNEDKVC